MKTKEELAAFDRGMDAVFLVLEDVEKRVSDVSLETLLDKAGTGLNVNRETYATLVRLWSMCFPAALKGVIASLKRDCKMLSQEMRCVTNDIDPEHMARLAAAARGVGINPGGWRNEE